MFQCLDIARYDVSLTAMDPTSALIVVDLQMGTITTPTAHPVQHVIDQTNVLIRAFRRRRLPIVFTQVAGRPPGRTAEPRASRVRCGYADLAPGLALEPTDPVMTSFAQSAFIRTELDRLLRERGVSQVVLCGISTSWTVESTVRQAFDLAYNVTVAVDAVTDPVLACHVHSVERVFPRFAETGPTRDVVRLLSVSDPGDAHLADSADLEAVDTRRVDQR